MDSHKKTTFLLLVIVWSFCGLSRQNWHEENSLYKWFITPSWVRNPNQTLNQTQSIELVENGEKLGGQSRCARMLHNPPRLTVLKALVRSTKAAYRPMFCSLHFSCICLCIKIMSTVPLLDLSPHRLSGVSSCNIVGMGQQDASQGFACNEEYDDASIVWAVWFSPLFFPFFFFFFHRETMAASLRSCGRIPFSQQLVNRSWR